MINDIIKNKPSLFLKSPILISSSLEYLAELVFFVRDFFEFFSLERIEVLFAFYQKNYADFN